MQAGSGGARKVRQKYVSDRVERGRLGKLLPKVQSWG